MIQSRQAKLYNQPTTITVSIHGSWPRSLVIVEHFGHIDPFELVAETPVVVPSSNTRDDRDLATTMLLSSDTFSLLHQKRSDTLMLEHLGISTVYLNRRPIYVLGEVEKANMSARVLHSLPDRVYSPIPERCCIPHRYPSTLSGTSPLPNTFSTEASQRGYLAQDPRTRGMSPTLHWRYSLFARVPATVVVRADEARTSISEPCQQALAYRNQALSCHIPRLLDIARHDSPLQSPSFYQEPVDAGFHFRPPRIPRASECPCEVAKLA
jgi:hypothetical protein